MKIYINTFDLARPVTRKITVTPYSTFGIGVKVLLNGQPTESPITMEVGETPITAESDLIDGFTIFKVSSGENGEVDYTVKCAGQTFYLTQTVNGEAGSFEVADEGGGEPVEKYGATINDFLGDVVNGVLQTPSGTLSIEIDDVTSITTGTAAYTAIKNYRTTYFSLPNLTTVGSGLLGMMQAFVSMSGLKEINFPSLSSVGESGMQRAFMGCTSLKTLSLPSMTNISQMYSFQYAFSGCTGLEVVSMPNLTTIGVGGAQYAFNGCTSLKYVDFSHLSSIGQQGVDYMFKGCTSLEYVDFRNATSVPSDPSSNAKQVLFQNTNDTFKVIVPDALYDSWIANYYWSSMATQIVKASEYPLIMTQYGGNDNMDNYQ